MKASPIILTPDVEAVVNRINIGEGQPEYFTIPSIVAMREDGIPVAMSRWVMDDDERQAVSRSAMRSAVIAFAMWLDDPANLTRALMSNSQTLAYTFLQEHSATFDGPDADLWYSRLMLGGPFQPMDMEIAVDAPVVLVERDPSIAGTIFPDMPNQVQ